MKLSIDTDEIKLLAKDGDKIFIDPSSEQSLLELYRVRDEIDRAIDEAKLRIETQALTLNPNFSSIKGDKIKVMYRAYGARYKIDESMIDQTPKELYTPKVTLIPNTDAIDEYIESHDGKIPVGILEADRNKQVSITIKKDDSQT